MRLETEQLEIARQRLAQVFRFLEAFNQLRNPVKRQIREQSWVLWLRDVPEHPSIQKMQTKDSATDGADVSSRDSETAEALDSASAEDYILRVCRPRLTSAPVPPPELRDWLLDGWDDPADNIQVQPSLQLDDAQAGAVSIRFGDDPDRPRLLERWRRVWEEWAQNERPARDAMRVFERLYELHAQIEREPEQVELVLGDGILNWRRPEGGIHHPIILQRLHMEFEPATPEFRLTETERPVELYSSLFRSVSEVDGRVVAKLRDELERAGYHPLAGDATSRFLQRMVIQLSPRGEFVGNAEPRGEEDYPRLGRDPVIFLRKRTLGFATAIEAILEDLTARDDLPPALLRIVGIEGPPSERDEPGGNGIAVEEDERILLTKAANSEQLQIARRLEQHGSVLVQGPPGTGKTHTIANLIGHLLAEGKSVLVTSHRTKALRVLREQVESVLQPLCVSVLESDIQSRQQLEGSVQAIVQRLSDDDRDRLENDARALAQQRKKIVEALRENREKLLKARTDEYRDVVVAGDSYPPSDAARRVADGRARDDWIPSPVAGHAPLPLSPSEVIELYRTNGTIAPEDEKELQYPLPATGQLVSPSELRHLVCDLNEVPVGDERAVPLWQSVQEEPDPEALEELLRRVMSAVGSAADEPPWRLAAIQAGYLGGTHREPWESLLSLTEEAYERGVEAQESILRYAPSLADDIPLSEQPAVLDEIVEFLRGGGRLGKLALLTRPRWRRLIEGARVNDRPARTIDEFASLRQLATLQERRRDLQERWERFMVPLGAASLPGTSDSERIAAQYLQPIRDGLGWQELVMKPLEEDLRSVGFRWPDFIASVPPRTDQTPELLRLRDAVQENLQLLFDARIRQIRRNRAERRVVHLRKELAPTALAEVVKRLDDAVARLDPVAYSEAYERLQELKSRADEPALRRRLLEQLDSAAPGWAAAIRDRTPPHDSSEVPGDAAAAWLWRQLNDELEARSQTSLDELQAKLCKLKEDLRLATTELVDRLAWKAQLQRTSLRQRQALMGWLDAVRRIGRGTGRRAPRLRVEAQRLMNQSRDAVPVWIMPLSRVVENFDPRTARFDVLVIDEASQSDALALIALYLAEGAVIVGDHQQVSPEAVGLRIDEVEHLIREHLQGIPNAVLYDGQQSVYGIAMQSFGGLISLREHFRCAPDIIQFSNELSYNGQIKPLRDPSQVSLRPHVVEYRVEGFETTNNVNEAEAVEVASLLAAGVEQPEYAGKTLGVISLLGEEQARVTDQLLREHLEPAEYERRRIICGNAAHFQGDERDVMFLSLVHGPGSGPLRLLEAGPYDMSKKRFNVAASRARDQMWVVHSLNSEVDLQPGDLRRRLIEHARDPLALARRIEKEQARAESDFEKQVLQRLVSAGFRAVSQWQVGYYRIDLVVEGGGRRVAVECDGDRYHPLERLRDDMERQAILERVGWTFIRIRGTEFYRNPEGTMKRVMEHLSELGVQPEGSTSEIGGEIEGRSELLERVIRRASELREQWKTSRYDSAPQTVTDQKSLQPVTSQSPAGASQPRTRVPSHREKRAEPRAASDVSMARRGGSGESERAAPASPSERARSRAEIPPDTDLPSDMQQFKAGARTKATIDFVSFLTERGVEVVDKRPQGGALWAVGGPELGTLMAKIREKGVRFQFVEHGGRATRYRPAWFTNEA